MPDERDTQTAAPSTDGDTPQNSQATATQEPPESPAVSGAEASEAPASPAPDPQPKSNGAQAEGAKAESEQARTKPTDDATGDPETETGKVEGEETGEPQAATDQTEAAQTEAEPAEKPRPEAQAGAAEETAPKAGEDVQEDVKSEPDTGEATPAAAQTAPRAAAGEELQPEAAEAVASSETAAEKPEAQEKEEPTAQEKTGTAAETEETETAEARPQDAPAATVEEPKAETGEAPPAATETATEPATVEEPAEKAGETKAAEAGTGTDTAEATPAAAAAASAEPTEAAAGKPEAAEAADKAEEAKAAADQGKEPPPPELDDPTLKELRNAKEEGTTVTGKVIGWNRGGFHVVIDEVTAFCPASEMEMGRPRSPDTYMDREMEFKVAKFQRRGRRVVLSRSEVLKTQRDEILASLQPGAVVKGNVTSLPDFGAFVDLGGVEGLVHVSEISRARVKKPSDVLQMGQEVEVKILKIEKGGDRISLSMKELEPDPWKDIADKYPRGSKFTGKVLRHADFGMFVELEPDVEGLVHVSQMEPGQEMSDEALQPGKTIEGWIREVEPKRERISLSLREVPEEDPWKTVQTRFPEGETVEGTVESIAPFGVFIHLAPGLTGLLPNSQTGLPRGTSAARAFRPGQTVQIQVLSIDTRRKRISLGKPGARVEATKADLQEYRQQQKQQEKAAPSAMEAAFARLGLGTEEDEQE